MSPLDSHGNDTHGRCVTEPRWMERGPQRVAWRVGVEMRDLRDRTRNNKNSIDFEIADNRIHLQNENVWPSEKAPDATRSLWPTNLYSEQEGFAYLVPDPTPESGIDEG